MIHSINSLVRRTSLAGLLLALTCAPPLFAVNEDEWYDPTDWFDGDNVELDDPYDGFYDYSSYYDYDGDWDRYDVWGDDIWEPDYYDTDYWDNYNWSGDGTNTASTSRSSTPSSSTSSGSNSQVASNSGSSDSSGSRSSNRANSATGTQNSATADDAIVYTYVLFAEPAPTGQQRASSPSASSSQQSGKQVGGQGQIARLNGTIEGLREMNLQRRSGATGTHTIAKIKLENGKSTVVSLGRSSQLEDLNLRVGDKIQAVGRRGTIDGETVFVANSFRAKGQTIAANPAIRLDRSKKNGLTVKAKNEALNNEAGAMTGSTSNQAQTTLHGEVASVTRASSGQADKQHTLVEVKLKNGQTSTVDLGPAASLEKIGLEKGDDITVQGHRSQVNGRDVLVADLLKVDGEKVSSVSR